MEPSSSTYGPVHFLNIEYFFRLIYDLVFHTGGANLNFGILLTEIWSFVTFVALITTACSIGILAYGTVRLRQLWEEEEPEYETIEEVEAESGVEHARWAHVQSLIESPHESDWRQAIIEADIMLDDALTLQGYVGDSVGDKLKQADPGKFRTLQDAWEAHKVRNDIAHQGSAYELTGNIAYRTIGRYKNVFEELRVI